MTQIALITGANKGIGYETARLLIERGMTVLMGARDSSLGGKAAESLGGQFIQLDVTSDDDVTAAAKHIDETYGRLDILINNAGIAGGFTPPSGTAIETMRHVYETNVFGVIRVTNALLPLLRKAPAARIVNVSSEVGSIATMTNQDSPLWSLTSLPYPTSKTALNMVTAMYAKELWDTQIKINAANPGYCRTDLNHNNGFRTPTQGAEISVELATLPADGPTGLLWGSNWASDSPDTDGPLPW